MTTSLHMLCIFTALVCAGCQTPTAPSAPTAAAPVSLHMKAGTLTFKSPGREYLFTLHLGEELNHDTDGVTGVPSGIHWAMRDATSSYYEPTDPSGGGYAAAESLYPRGWADVAARNTDIQYAPDTQRILITEEKSDGRPCRRYILYTPYREGGYKVTYLSPAHKVAHMGNLPGRPPDIRLLPNDRARIEGKVVKIDAIDQSTHPFSVGG
jgi:hypothetical protein